MEACNAIGSPLDTTATPVAKLIDRQKAHMLVYKVIYGVLSDSPENDYREEDWQNAQQAIEQLNNLKSKTYIE